MQSTATSGRIAATAVARLGRPRRPSWRRVMGITLTATILLGLSSVASTVAYLRVPDPTGSFVYPLER